MIDKVFVDFGRTFGSGVFLGVEPKMARKDKNDPKSEQVQARDNDGNLKWAAAIAVKVQGFGKSKQEVLSVTLSSPTEPCAGMPMGEAVKLEGMELGIMKNEKGGFTVFFVAEDIVPAAIGRAKGAPASSVANQQ